MYPISYIHFVSRMVSLIYFIDFEIMSIPLEALELYLQQKAKDLHR